MKYFTREWHTGSQPEDEQLSVQTAYAHHLQQLTPQLPGPLQDLAQRTNLHDGLIRSVNWHQPTGLLHLNLRCGDRQVGYFDLDLSYRLVPPLDEPLQQLHLAADDPRTEILYDEVDLSPSGFIHRILFWPYREVSLTFSDFSMTRRNVGDREDRTNPQKENIN